MGCSHSKDTKRPSKGVKGPPWNRILHRLSSVHADPSIETEDGAYIAAVFSANGGIITKPAPTKILETHASMPKPSGKGINAQLTYSWVEGRKNRLVQKESHVDTVVGIPVLHTNHEPKSPAAALKSTESAYESLETINVFELMKGLAEDEFSADFHLWDATSEPSMHLMQVLDGQKGSSIDGGAQSGKFSTRSTRPKSSSSFKSIEDVDRVLSVRRSEMASNSSTAEMMDSNSDGNGSQDADNSRRALSFKYILNNSCGKEHDFLYSTGPSASCIRDRDERVGRRFCDDLLLVPARRVVCDGDADGFCTNTEFSPASLKDWLPPRNPPVCLKEGLQLSIPGASSEIGALLECFDGREETQLTGVQKVSMESPSMCPYQQRNADLFSGLEEFGSPLFDPEMLESFEAAMKNLSEEEWDAVRRMEDSPRHFLRLVTELKKSSSSKHAAFEESVRVHTDGAFSAMDDAKHAMGIMDSNKDQCGGAVKLLDVKLKTLCLEKKLAYIRQNSLEVRRALASVKLMIDDTEGVDMVVFYSTTSRANSKTYEDCNRVRSILHSLMGVSYVERSVSEFLEHKQELQQVLNVLTTVVPTISVKGKCLVGADSISQLYKKGVLGVMLQAAESS